MIARVLPYPMKRRTIILSFLIVASSALLAVFILGRGALAPRKDVAALSLAANVGGAAPTPSGGDLNNSAFPTPPVLASGKSTTHEFTAPANPEPTPAPDNATERLAQKLTAQITSRNPSSLGDLNPQELIDKALSEEFSGVDLGMFRPTVPVSSIKTNGVVNAETVRSYIESLGRIANGNRYTDLMSQTKPSFEDITKLRDGAERMRADLLALTVPTPFARWHADYVSYVIAQKNIFGAIADTTSDPLKAALALQAVSLLDTQAPLLEADLKRVIAHIANPASSP